LLSITEISSYITRSKEQKKRVAWRIKVSAVKKREQDLYIYQIYPVSPKKEDLQEYIYLYFAERDDKYLMWFLHCDESVINNTSKYSKRLIYR